MKKILCWFLALLLTGTLALFCFSYVCAQAVAPALREGGTAVSDEVQREEMQLIKSRITELASIYEFSADTAMKYVTAEKLAEMNRQAAVWWNSLLTTGEAGEAPALDTEELTAAFEADLTPAGGEAELSEDQQLLAADSANAVAESVLRVVLPMRLPLVGIGTEKAAERVDVGNVIRFLTGIRWAALALCALLAGLIALLESRKLRMSLKYIGSAMGASVLVLAGGAVLYALTGIGSLIAGASPGLDIQYGHVLSGAMIRLIVCAVILAAGCVVCLILCRRTHEAETD